MIVIFEETNMQGGFFCEFWLCFGKCKF